MEFGPVPLHEAEGAILAHSQVLPQGRLRKGRVLGADDIAALQAAGLAEVIVARLGPGDLGEDAAATRVAQALVPNGMAGLRLTEATTGRVNIYATAPGLLTLDVARMTALNLVEPMITFATLPPFARLAERTLVGTVKIIAYGVAETAVAQAEAVAAGTLGFAPTQVKSATLIQTDVGAGPGKGEDAIRARLSALGADLVETVTVAHAVDALAQAVVAARGEIVLILTASATSDASDVGPMAVRQAGGQITRFGMPVDPGNLLFLGALEARPVIGLPGCARSPAMNGADWVLERVVCGLPPSAEEIAAMGIGGLLKESPARGLPRERPA